MMVGNTSRLPYGIVKIDRYALYDFVAAELNSRAPSSPHRLGLICRQLDRSSRAIFDISPT